MIRVEVEPYCHECLDFEPDLERPKRSVLHGDDLSGKRMVFVTVVILLFGVNIRNAAEKSRSIWRSAKNWIEDGLIVFEKGKHYDLLNLKNFAVAFLKR